MEGVSGNNSGSPRPRRGLYVNIRGEESSTGLPGGHERGHHQPRNQGVLARHVPRRGSDDHLRPVMPSPGDLRRMFGDANINGEPEYMRSSDPIPWEVEREDESTKREAMKAWLQKTLVRRRDPEEAAEVLLSALGLPPGEDAPCTLEDIATVKRGLNKDQLNALSTVYLASARRPAPVAALGERLLREGKVAASRVRDLASQVLETRFSMEMARAIVSRVAVDEREATLILGKALICGYLNNTRRESNESHLPEIKPPPKKANSKKVPSYLKQTESFLQKVRKAEESEKKVGRVEVKRPVAAKRIREESNRRVEDKLSFRSVPLKEPEDSLNSINMDDVRTCMDKQNLYSSSFAVEKRKKERREAEYLSHSYGNRRKSAVFFRDPFKLLSRSPY